jgi:aspartate 1-decarboxylase
VICINGAAARLVNPGDEVIIMAYGYMEPQEARDFKPDVVLVDKSNRISEKL